MSRDVLLATGATLAMLGVIARGLASSQRRMTALRKQHELDRRKAGESVRPVPHLEKYLARYANGAIAAGLVVLVFGFLR